MDISEKINKTSFELKKHVGAIHSAGALSLLQRKIANTLLYNAYDDLMIKDEFSISIKQLCHLIGYDSNDYKTVKTALVKLLSTVIEWNLIDKDSTGVDEIWNASAIIADASIQDSICTYSYSKRMRELLYMPEMYGRINMSIQAKFQSNYGLALYENCNRYKNLPYTPWIDFALFRKLMGVDEKKYTIFRDFKRRVLDKSVQEVNQFSDFNVEPDVLKEQGRVTSIRFKLTKSKKLIPEIKNDTDSEVTALLQELHHVFSIKPKMAEDLIVEYGIEHVKEKMEYVKTSHSFKNNNVKNLSGYLLSALKHNFSSVEEKVQPIKKKNIKNTYGLTIDEVIDKFKSLSSEVKQAEIMSHFSTTIENDQQRKHVMQYGICNSLIAEEFRSFIFKNYSEILI